MAVGEGGGAGGSRAAIGGEAALLFTCFLLLRFSGLFGLKLWWVRECACLLSPTLPGTKKSLRCSLFSFTIVPPSPPPPAFAVLL